MKKIFTQQNIDQFYKEFKALPNSFTIEKVHQLINNPYAKATHKVNFHFNHLKIIIMTSALIVGVSSLVFWLTPISHGTNHRINKTNPDKSVVVTPLKNKSAHNLQIQTNKKELSSNKRLETNNPELNKYSIPEKESTEPPKNSDKELKMNRKATCNWPTDTVIDKSKLHIYLTNAELEKLGIHIVNPSGRAFYYYSVEGKNSSSQCWNVPCRSDTMKPSPFYIKALTDTLCTTERWGSDFYAQVDTLLPVIPKEFENKNKIFWFLPGDSIFKVLPEKYRFLKETFQNLKCVKKSYPDRNIVNHWDIKRNTVLDKINYLELDQSELTAIGVTFKTDGIVLTDPTETFYYRHDKWGTEKSTIKPDSSIDFPNRFPTLITDIKGLEMHRYGHRICSNNVKNSKENFDLLIPVLMPLSKYVPGRDYELIFWYYPTEDFIDALPLRIRGQLNAELKSIRNGDNNNTSSCTYFEACKSTLRLGDLKVYPNPTFNNITIDFSLPEAVSGKIILANISGAFIKSLVPENNFHAGLNSFNANLADVAPGVYLISIITQQGFKTQRIIVSH